MEVIIINELITNEEEWVLDNQSNQRNAEENNGNNNGKNMEYSINASFGAVDIAGSTKNTAKAGTFLLE